MRARVGYAFDRLLVYGTGGVAFTEATAKANFIAVNGPPISEIYGGTAYATNGSGSATLAGGTVGVGFEYALTPQISAGAEARYTWYGSHTYSTGTVQYSRTIYPPVTQTYDLNNGVVLLKLNYKLY